jgi:hypothetical protein
MFLVEKGGLATDSLCTIWAQAKMVQREPAWTN